MKSSLFRLIRITYNAKGVGLARLASHKGMISLRQLRSAGGEELSALMQSILDKAFKGEL